MSSERSPTAPTPEPLPPAATFLPARVRNWLTARYLADPTPGRWPLAPGAAPEPVVFVRFEEFAAFLLDAGVDLLPNLDAWRAAGWMEDFFAQLRPSDDPAARPPDFRLALPPGDHRLVAIRRAVLDAPTEPMATATRHPERSPSPTHLQRIDAQASAINTKPPRGLDPELADAYVATAVAFRECTRLIDSAPALWEDATAYRRLAAGVHVAADAARTAFEAVDIRLRRAGGPHVMREALNDVLSVQAHAPLDLGGRPGALNAAVTRLLTHGAKLFARVDGRGLLDRLRDQLARVPPEASGRPVAAGQPGDAPPAEQFGDASALVILARETWWWKAHRPARGGADEADALNARMPAAEREAMRVVPFGTAGYDEWERRVKAVRAAFAELLRCGDHGPDRTTRLDALGAAMLDLERAAVAARGSADAHPPAADRRTDTPSARRGGRPKLTASKKPTDQAKRNVYELVRAVKATHPSIGEKQLIQHFKADRSFRDRLKDADLTFGEGLFRAALAWIAQNPGQETRSGNDS